MPCPSNSATSLNFISRIFSTAALAALATLGTAASANASVAAHFSGVETTISGCSSECFGVAVDTSGNVYIADTYNNRVLKETPSAIGYMQSVIATGLNKPYGVAVDTNGNVYVADTYNFQIVKETLSSGTYTPSVIASNLPTFNVAVDALGNVYVAGGSLGTSNAPLVDKLTPSGSSYSKTVVADSSSGMRTPWEVAVDSNGAVYVTDSDGSSVYKETPSGNSYVQSTIATGLNFPTGVAVDSMGNVYVANARSNQILMESPASGGGYTQSIYGTGPLNFPYELAVDTLGNLYIANPQAFKILKETPGGVNFGSVNVGAQSSALKLIFLIDSAGAIGTPSVVTQGASNLDFADAGTGSCTTNGTSLTYSAGQTCILNVVFQPTVSGLVSGAAVLKDHAGNQIAVAYLHGNGVSPQVSFLPGTQTSLPSSGLQGPSGIAVDASGNVFFIDANNVMKETYSSGGYTLSTLFSNLSSPAALALDGAGNIYIAEVTSRRVIRETPYSGGYYQSLSISGLSLPTGLAVDSGGKLFIADWGAFRVYRVSPTASGFTTTSIGSGLRYPFSITVDGAGVVYIGDGTDGQLTVETPGPSGYTQSVLTLPDTVVTQLAADMRGNLYTTGQAASTALKWTPSTEGYVQSSLGTNISYPLGITPDRNGNVFIANEGSAQVLEIDFEDPPALSFASTSYQSTSADSPKTITLQNIGNAALDIPAPASGNNPSISNSFTLGDGASACPLVSAGSDSGSLSAGASCELSIGFTPEATGTIAGSLVLTDNALNGGPSKQTISLSGVATQATPVISWPTPAAITYGAALSATQLDATTTVPGAFAYSPAAGSILAPGAPTLSVTFTPTDTTDYTTATTSVTLTVNPAPLSVTADNQSMIYGGTLPSLTGTITGVISGDGITATYNTTATAASPVGQYAITATLNDPNAKLGNYAVTNIPGTLIIAKAAPTITWATPAAIAYGAALTAAQLNASANVPGTFAYSPTAGTVLGVGSQTLTTTFTPTDGTNFATATGSVTLTVNQATPVIALASSANPADVPQAITFTATVTSPAGAPTGTVTFFNGTIQLGSAALSAGSAAYTTSALTAGSYSITAVYSGDTNFVSVTSSVLTQSVAAFAIASASGGTTSATVALGGTATYNLNVTPPGDNAVTFTVTGLPSGATSSFSPSTVAAGAPTTAVKLSVTVPSQSAAALPEHSPRPSQKPIAFGLVLLSLPFLRRLRKGRHVLGIPLLCLAGAASLAVLSGCGGGSNNGGGHQPQTFNLTVTATAGSQTQSINLTLTVQ